MEAAQEKWFEAVWADREERVYREFFGNVGERIHTIPARVFAEMGKSDPDARYLTHGVLECPPTGERTHWIYVSSGMSNPWGEGPGMAEAGKYSGLGMEFTLHVPGEARWAIALLHWVMAAQLLIASGEMESPLVEFGDRIPLGRPLLGKEGGITHLLVTRPPGVEEGGYGESFELKSGRVDVMLLLGITGREAEFVATQDGEALVALLRHREVFPVTDPGRVGAV